MVTNKTRSTAPKLPYEAIAKKMLGKNYSLSIVFVGSSRARKLNKDYGGKDYEANVLTFPIASDMAEIFINLPLAKKEAKKEKTSLSKRVQYLLIHGILHLKGYSHGKVMDQKQDYYIGICNAI